jgi:hypothetical protein
MVNDRWSYMVVDVKPGFLGSTRDAAQERLTQLGLQGWELVSAIQPQRFAPVQMYLKKPLA